jgi:hypothetical protein
MKFALLGAAALAATALASPSQAQQVISEPGYCAQFYPDANCQNLGPGNPYTSDGWRTNYDGYRNNDAYRDNYAYMAPARVHHVRRHHNH